MKKNRVSGIKRQAGGPSRAFRRSRRATNFYALERMLCPRQSPRRKRRGGSAQDGRRPAAKTPARPAYVIVFVELLELIAIRLGSPEANKQLPRNDKDIRWLQQVPSEGRDVPPLEKKIDALTNLVRSLGAKP